MGETEIDCESNASGDGWSWNALTRTMTLNGINLELPAPEEDDETALFNAVTLPSDSTLEVNGTNRISYDYSAGTSIDTSALCAVDCLTVTGSGSLETNGSVSVFDTNDIFSDSVRKYSKLTVNDNVNWTSSITNDYCTALYASEIVVNGGQLDFTGNFSAIFADTLTVNGGEIVAKVVSDKDPMELGYYPAAVCAKVITGNDVLIKGKGTDGKYSTAATNEEAITSLFNTTKTMTLLSSDRIATDVRIYFDPDTSISVNADGVSVSADSGVFPYNTVVTINKLDNGAGFEMAKSALGNIAESFIAFDLTAVNAGSTVLPNGKVRVTFEIPEGFETDKLAIYYVSSSTTCQKLNFTLDAQKKYATVELDHFSTYALVKTKAAAPTGGGSPNNTGTQSAGSNNTSTGNTSSQATTKSPKTGETPFVFPMLVIAFVSAGTAIAFKKKKAE